MIQTIAEMNLKEEGQYQQVCEILDINNCAKYYAAEYYIVNVDWPTANYAVWRSREKLNESYCDGRWRWILYDTNWAMMPSWYQMKIDSIIDQDPLFASLMDNKDFQRLFENELVYLAEFVFEPSKMEQWIDDYSLRMKKAVVNEYRRYYGDGKNESNFEEECESLKEFFSKRYTYIMTMYGGKHE